MTELHYKAVSPNLSILTTKTRRSPWLRLIN